MLCIDNFFGLNKYFFLKKHLYPCLRDIGILIFIKITQNTRCLLISSLPGKAFRTLVESRGLPSDSTYVFENEPGKLDIKRRKPAILFISLPIGSLYKLATMTLNYLFLCRFSVNADVIQKMQHHLDLIKTH